MNRVGTNNTGSHNRPDFRNDINGLRAWAVAVVVLFHFGVPLFDGGFVGVDVFFVISGFLMTGIVVKGLERGTFSVWSFYMARARRIVPALLVLCAVLLALGWWLLISPDYKKLAIHALSSVTFASNIAFWQEAGYFDDSSHEKWLLHTWSLSVEWQFYLLLPLVLWAVWRIKPGRTAQGVVVAAGLVVSLALSVWLTPAHPSDAFYWLHTRAWEMLAGGMVFLLAPYIRWAPHLRRVLEVVGLLLIVLAVIRFHQYTSWPGWRALVPVLGAVLVLITNRQSLWTGNRVAQWIGDRSYSLYLWHWPVVVALGYVDLRANPWAIAGGIALSAFLGHVSYVWVEGSSRRVLERVSLNHAASGLIASVVVVAVSAGVVWNQHGFTHRFAPAVELAAGETHNFNQRKKECHPERGLNLPTCVYGKAGAQGNVIVVGDSHASALVSALIDPRGQAGVEEWSYSGCRFERGLKTAPHMMAEMGGADYKCSEFIDWGFQRLAQLPADKPVVVIGRYAQAALGFNEDHPVYDKPQVYFSKVYERTTPEFLAEFASHITASACELVKHRTVYLMRPIPEMGFNVPKTLSRRMMVGQNDDLFITIEDYQKRNAWVWAAQDAARDQCGVKILDPTAVLCRDGRCYGSQKGRPLYYDDDHLSEFGNKLLTPMFEEVFKGL